MKQEQNGQERAEYGTQLIEMLSKELTIAYGKGFSKRNLQYFRSFYLTFNDFQIVQTRLHNLKWSHFLTTLRVDNPVAARWYLQTASDEMWSVRTLDRKDIARYSVLNGNEQLFAAKYMPLMPTEEELRREIEQQKELYMLQQNNN